MYQIETFKIQILRMSFLLSVCESSLTAQTQTYTLISPVRNGPCRQRKNTNLCCCCHEVIRLCYCCDYGCCCHCAPMLCHCLLDCICPRGNRTSWHKLNLSQVGLSAHGPKHWGQTGLSMPNVCVCRSKPFCHNSYCWYIKERKPLVHTHVQWQIIITWLCTPPLLYGAF